MRFVIQRVKKADVVIEGKTAGSIQEGYAVLIGIAGTDTRTIADKMIRKLLHLRIFADADGKTNRSLQDVGGNLLLVSQFTLYADCRKGNRPSFLHAADACLGEELYEYVISVCRETFPQLQTGKFGADMQLSLVNDGPFTILLDSDRI